MTIKNIYYELINKYYNYYCTVYFEYITEAIKNTLQDLKNKKNITIDEIHQHIKENYI